MSSDLKTKNDVAPAGQSDLFTPVKQAERPRFPALGAAETRYPPRKKWNKDEEAQRQVRAATSFIEDALAIREIDAAAGNTIGFMARLLVQVTMPHSKLTTATYERSNGNIRVEMLATRASKGIGLPYGTYPRLITMWMTTEAVRTRSPTLQLGDSLAGWMRTLGLESRSGGPRGAIHSIRRHLERLYCAMISWTVSGPGDLNIETKLIEGKQLWWDPMNPDQVSFFDSVITLNQRFYEAIIERPVPLNTRSVKRLAQAKSPLAIDIYTWLTYRLMYLQRDQFISWESLQLQFGGDYGRLVDFRRKFASRLRLVKELYTAAQVFPTETGLLLKPSPPDVPMRSVRPEVALARENARTARPGRRTPPSSAHPPPALPMELERPFGPPPPELSPAVETPVDEK